jgi:uncharacterized Ntn-hydrolase superfamily protein
MTYSLIARDEETGELGVAVQSRAFRTGAVCAWARAGVGAIATQSFTDMRYGARGLELLATGVSPREALARLLADDERPEFRQVAFLGADGQTAAHTGDACVPAAGHIDEADVSVQGNMLASTEVWPAMLEGFRSARGSLADRLLEALDAAEAAGGDFRGRQAGAVLVVSAERADARPWDGRVVDVRVDDSDDPVGELRRLVRLSEAHRRIGRPAPGASPDDEMEAARAAGLREDEVVMTGAAAAAAAGDLERATALLRSLVEADGRWLDAFERYERLGFLPPGTEARLT